MPKTSRDVFKVSQHQEILMTDFFHEQTSENIDGRVNGTKTTTVHPQ